MRRVGFGIALALALGLGLHEGASAQARAGGRISFMVSGEPAEKAAYEALVKEFQRRHPGIQVGVVYVPDPRLFPKRLLADFAAGTPPDVFLLNYRRYAAFADKDVLEPLDDYVRRVPSFDMNDFYPEAVAPFRWKGRLMAIPQNLSSLVVYYNRALFRKAQIPYPTASWTWADFLAAAKAMTRDTDGDRRIDQYGLGTEASIVRVTPFLWANGASLVDDDAAPTRLTLDTPQAREALEWFVGLQTRHHVVPDRAAEKARDHESRFLDGTVAMILDSRRAVPTFRTIRSFDWDVAPLPRGKQPAGLLHADAFFMAATSKNKAAAWAFIAFAGSVDGQRLLSRTGRTVPSRRSVAESAAFLAPGQPPQSNRVFLEVIPHVRALPVMPLWPGLETRLSEEFERAFHGEATLEEALKTAAERTRDHFGKH